MSNELQPAVGPPGAPLPPLPLSPTSFSASALASSESHALATHSTAPCLRALAMDTARVRPALAAALAFSWALATGSALSSLVRDRAALATAFHLPSLARVLRALVALVLRLMAPGSTQTAAPFSEVKLLLAAVLKAAALVAWVLLSYCPLGRLGFGRPLRRLYISLSQPAVGLGEALRQLLATTQVQLALANVLLLPPLHRLLLGAGHALPAAVGRPLAVAVAALRLTLTTTSALALYTALRPQHLEPSNPWRAEPDFARFHPAAQATEQTASGQRARVGVLVCNLGTPPSPRAEDVARFLREFLSDPRVVEIYPWVWRRVLNNLIIPFRKYSSGRLYQRLFDTVQSAEESPLLYYTRRFASRMASELGPRFEVALGMRCVRGSGRRAKGRHPRAHVLAVGVQVRRALDPRRPGRAQSRRLRQGALTAARAAPSPQPPTRAAKAAGGNGEESQAWGRRTCPCCFVQVIVLAEYPQYSSTTTASIYDEVFDQLKRYRNVPSIRLVPPYFAHPAYIASLAAVTRAFLENKPKVDMYIFSFHGIPERYHLRGDPYPWHCEGTAEALAAALALPGDQWVLTYQSVFGKDPWLRPATDATVEALAKQGKFRTQVACGPGPALA